MRASATGGRRKGALSGQLRRRSGGRPVSTRGMTARRRQTAAGANSVQVVEWLCGARSMRCCGRSGRVRRSSPRRSAGLGRRAGAPAEPTTAGAGQHPRFQSPVWNAEPASGPGGRRRFPAARRLTRHRSLPPPPGRVRRRCARRRQGRLPFTAPARRVPSRSRCVRSRRARLCPPSVLVLRCLRQRVAGGPLRVLACPPAWQVCRDARRPRRVTARRRGQPGRRLPLDHRQHGPAPERPPARGAPASRPA